MKGTFKKAIIQSIPVMAGYIVLGFAFGILLVDKGYSIYWAILMSVVIYAGSMQFVTINLLTGGASLISSALMTVMVNARHFFYGISMLSKYKNMGKAKPYLIFGLTDETYALVCVEPPEDVDKKKYYLYITFCNQCYWIIGTIIGALVGGAISFNTRGIDFSMTALFVIIFTEQLLSTKNYQPAIVGIGASLLCLFFFGATNFLIPTMLVITLLLVLQGLYQSQKRGSANE